MRQGGAGIAIETNNPKQVLKRRMFKNAKGSEIVQGEMKVSDILKDLFVSE